MIVEWTPVLASLLILTVLLLARVPVAFALAAGAVVGYALLTGLGTADATLASLPFSVVADPNLVLVPMFMVMGLLANAGGILPAVFDLAERVLRRVPGGLAVAATVSAGFLGGISGSSVADTATLGRITVEHMRIRGYNPAFAAAVVAASNTVAVMIPPSLALVLVGILSEQPIGPLLLAGIVPGVLTVIAYAVCCLYLARFRPQSVFTQQAVPAEKQLVLAGANGGILPAPPASTDAPFTGLTGGQDWVVRAVGVAAGVLLIVTVLGGLYSGVFTAVEAAFAGASVALTLALTLIFIRRRRLGEGDYRDLLPPFREAAGLTGMVFLLLVGATLYSNFLIVAGLPSYLADAMLDSSVPPLAIVALFLLVTLLLGMILDPLAILLIVGPIAFPVITALGYSEIWFAILFVKSIEIGLLTPPVGLNVFVVASVTKGVRVEQVFARIVPFIATEMVVLVTLFFVPALSTWLALST